MEALLMIIEYHILKKCKVLPILFLSIVMGIGIYFFSKQNIFIPNVESFHSNILNILGILLGFSISTLAILLSVENDNIKAAKAELIKDKKGTTIKLYNREISLFELVSMELVYIIILQGVLLIANFIYPHFVDIISNIGKIIYCINISLISYCILLLINNILSLYFILTKKK